MTWSTLRWYAYMFKHVDVHLAAMLRVPPCLLFTCVIQQQQQQHWVLNLTTPTSWDNTRYYSTVRQMWLLLNSHLTGNNFRPRIIVYSGTIRQSTRSSATVKTARDGHHYALLRSFKVTNVDTNRKPVCDFILVTNTNWHPISHRFLVIALYLSHYLVKKLETLLSRMVRNVFSYPEPFKRGPRVWRTDEQTDRRIEVQTEWRLVIARSNIVRRALIRVHERSPCDAVTDRGNTFCGNVHPPLCLSQSFISHIFQFLTAKFLSSCITIIIILFKSNNMAHKHKQETYRQYK